MNADLRHSLKLVLEFYREMGFDRVPIDLRGLLLLKSSEGKKESAYNVVESDKDIFSIDKVAALKTVRDEIGDCKRCRLSKERTHIVFGEGNPDSRIMFIGEGPGREEDIQGRPFVGDAGQLLTRLIEKMGFKRSDVYIANIVKCRPPMNRDPLEDEISTCLPFLKKQIAIVKPEVIISLGKVSTHTLLNIKEPMSKFSIMRIRGRFYDYTDGDIVIPIMPTFHPAYLMRNPNDKWLTWSDAQAVLKRLEAKR